MKRGVLIGVTVLLAGLLCFCAYRYYDAEIRPEQALSAENEKQLALFSAIRPEDDLPQGGDSAAEAPSPLKEAEQVNSGVVGWVRIPGTSIDYPIAQSEDNAFYLTHGFDGQENGKLGCPFLDYRCDADFSGFNSIVYAHHLKRGRMFADIARFKDSSFMDRCPTGYLITEDGQYTVRFFAYLNVPNTAAAYHTVFVTERERQEYLDYLKTAAEYTRGIDSIGTDAHLLLLSTCTYEFTDARGVLAGVIEGLTS